jgi:tetratricopeptide (TPR) repeat protein
VNSLGLLFHTLGQPLKAIEYFQQALAIARDIGDRQAEGACLGNLGSAFSDLGDEGQAIDYRQQSLSIARETGDRQVECHQLGNLGLSYQELGAPQKQPTATARRTMTAMCWPCSG